MKKPITLFLCILFMIISVNSIKYTGSEELCIINISGNVTCLSSGDSLSLSEDSTYYFTLNAENQPKTITSAVDYLEVLFTALIFGIVLIFGTYIIIKSIIIQ